MQIIVIICNNKILNATFKTIDIMKVKTINRIIRKKMQAWLSSIEDEALHVKVKGNIVLSGGSITSMLLQEDVNDFDIYIKDMNVCVELAEYYVDEFGVEVLDGRKKEEYIKDEGKEYIKKFYNDGLDSDDPFNETDYSWLTVILRNLHENQVKLLIHGAGLRPNFWKGEKEEDVKRREKSFQVAFISPNAISLTDDIQIVTRFTGTAEEIHKTYDFIHATNYWTFETGLVLNTEALACILTKELRYQGSLYPLTSIIRVKKFIARKWTCNAGEILKMCWQLNELDLRNPDVLEEQLIGVDIAYFSQLIIALREKGMEKVDTTYFMQEIDRVFNEDDSDL